MDPLPPAEYRLRLFDVVIGREREERGLRQSGAFGRLVRRAVACVAVPLAAECSPAPREAGTPSDDTAVVADTSRIDDAFRESGGGNVFVHFSRGVSAADRRALGDSGLAPPNGTPLSAPRFYYVSPPLAWGFLRAADVRRVATLGFVTMIEPSTVGDGVVPLE